MFIKLIMLLTLLFPVQALQINQVYYTKRCNAGISVFCTQVFN